MDEIPTPEWAISALIMMAMNLRTEGHTSRADALHRVAALILTLLPSREP